MQPVFRVDRVAESKQILSEGTGYHPPWLHLMSKAGRLSQGQIAVAGESNTAPDAVQRPMDRGSHTVKTQKLLSLSTR
jgi:hypothetical protein